MGSRSDDARRLLLWDEILRRAEVEGADAGVRHACEVARDVLAADGVVLYEAVDPVTAEPVATAGDGAARLAEAEITVGEGPALDAIAGEYPVLVHDVDAVDRFVRWPAFAPQALVGGVRAVAAFPVVMGAVVVGCLEVHHRAPVDLGADRIVDGLLLADAALALMLHGAPRAPGADPVLARWVTVRQAADAVAVQLGCDPATALLRLRAHAYSTDRWLGDVAEDVAAWRLLFAPEADAQSERGQG
ncbi:GAF domain-containing protein [Saccharothrix yanglingensis]|uniref:GAF domain-containing protein n=1 Tax=Saccharothrix yanglingensis TaxID=659496 RepID=UPI0027D1F1AE|nr:GAF domain-containing protein [Saccharothrix yanglingensis]